MGNVNHNIADAKLSIGTKVSDFSLAGRNAAEELQLCQRYYEKSYDIDTPISTNTKAGATSLIKQDGSVTDRAYANAEFKVEKRTTPVMAVYAPTSGVNGQFDVYNGGSVGTLTGQSWFTGSRGMAGWFDADIVLSVTLLHLIHWTADAEL